MRAAAALLLAGGLAGARGPVTATAGPYRLTLESLRCERESRVRFGHGERPAHRTRVELELRVTGAPAALERLAGGAALDGGAFRAVDDRGRPAGRVTASLTGGEGGPRLLVKVEGLPGGARALARVEGALAAYPRAEWVRFHIPWLKDDVPISAEVGGAVATLHRFQLVEADSTLWVTLRPPEGCRLAPRDHPGSVRARAHDIYGNLVQGGGITRVERTGEAEAPELRLFAPGLRRTPARLALEALFVAGEPARTRFRLGRIPLPGPP